MSSALLPPPDAVPGLISDGEPTRPHVVAAPERYTGRIPSHSLHGSLEPPGSLAARGSAAAWTMPPRPDPDRDVVELDDAMTDLLRSCQPAVAQLHAAVVRTSDGDPTAAILAGSAIAELHAASQRAQLHALERQCTTAAHAAASIAAAARDPRTTPRILVELTTLDHQLALYASVHREATALDAGASLIATLSAWTSQPEDYRGSMSELTAALAHAGLPSLVDAVHGTHPLAMRCAIGLLADAMAMFAPSRPRDPGSLRLERVHRELRAALDQIAQPSRALRRAVHHLAGVPLAALAPRCVRMIEMLASAAGKHITPHVELDDVLVPPRVAGAVSELLVHAIRNAVEHGVELPGVRAARAKPMHGHLLVTAHAVDHRLAITVRDDGHGVDLAQLRQLAIARRLHAPDGPLPDAQLLDLLFRPGVSTTAAPHRGFGLDIVRAITEELRGSVALSTITARHFELGLELPLPDA